MLRTVIPSNMRSCITEPIATGSVSIRCATDHCTAIRLRGCSRLGLRSMATTERIMAKPQVLPPKPNTLEVLFPIKKPIIGVIHLQPLPGAPRYGGQPVKEIYAAALADARTLSQGGVDGIILENGSDMPFARPE